MEEKFKCASCRKSFKFFEGSTMCCLNIKNYAPAGAIGAKQPIQNEPLTARIKLDKAAYCAECGRFIPESWTVAKRNGRLLCLSHNKQKKEVSI